MLVILAIVVAIAGYFLYKHFFEQKQSYGNVDGLEGVGGSIDNLDTQMEPRPEEELEYYSEIAEGPVHQKYQKVMSSGNNVMDDLQQSFDSMALPRVSSEVTPYNIDVADPQAWSFLANAPRVQLKNRQWQDADPYRGDIPIKYHPNVALVGKSIHDRDSQRMDGMFSDATKEASERVMGRAYKNMPILTSVGSTIGDYTQ